MVRSGRGNQNRMRLSRCAQLSSSELGLVKPVFDSLLNPMIFFPSKMGIMILVPCTLRSCSEHKMGNFAYGNSVYELPMFNSVILTLLSGLFLDNLWNRF